MKISFFLLVLVSMWACQAQQPADSDCKDAASDKAPEQWLDEQKKTLGQDEYKAEIYQLKYTWGYAYLINPCMQCADHFIYMYDTCGNAICQSGGIMGMNSCPAPYRENADRKLIWKED
jgi:hypothetical protein